MWIIANGKHMEYKCGKKCAGRQVKCEMEKSGMLRFQAE